MLAVYGSKKQVYVSVRLVTVSKGANLKLIFNVGLEVSASFVLVSCLTYSSTLNGANMLPISMSCLSGLHGFVSQGIKLF